MPSPLQCVSSRDPKTDCQSVPRFLRHDCPAHSACPRVPLSTSAFRTCPRVPSAQCMSTSALHECLPHMSTSAFRTVHVHARVPCPRVPACPLVPECRTCPRVPSVHECHFHVHECHFEQPPGKETSPAKKRARQRNEPGKETSPAKKRAAVTATLKAEVESTAKALIDKVLKPKHVQPPTAETQFNYVTDIQAKWFRNCFYFVSIYACPGPNALSPTFESKFARMEPLGDGAFALSFIRHNGEWVELYDAILLDDCMRAIRDDPWFVP